jgi:hypothetical protein
MKAARGRPMKMAAPKRTALERQQERRQPKEKRRAGKRRLTPLQQEIERCNLIAGHETTRAERDTIRQQEVAEIRDYIEAGRAENAHVAASCVTAA